MQTIFLQATGGESMMPTLIMFGLFFVFMYFVMLRPQMRKQKQEQNFQGALKVAQMRKQKQEQNFQGALKVGQRVVTTSGLHGRIAQIQEDGIVIETLSGKLKFEKSAISREFTAARFPDSTEDKK